MPLVSVLMPLVKLCTPTVWSAVDRKSVVWLVAHVAGVGGFMLAALIPVALCIAWVLIIGRAERTGIMALPTITKENCDRA